MLNELQFNSAEAAVCWIVTVVWPFDTLCVGVSAPLQVVTGLAIPFDARPESGTRPPGASPFETGTVGSVADAFPAGAPAAACAACMAWRPQVVRTSAACACFAPA